MHRRIEFHVVSHALTPVLVFLLAACQSIPARFAGSPDTPEVVAKAVSSPPDQKNADGQVDIVAPVLEQPLPALEIQPDKPPKPQPAPPLAPVLTLNERAALPQLFDRVRAGFQLPDLDDPAVERLAQYYVKQKVLERSAPRARLYLYAFVLEAERRGLPTELALLPYVESAFNPNARSSAGAVGACQFMPATGKRFQLAQSAWLDLRRDITRCSQAMFDYLEENHRRFGDWFLALAAYNAGEGAVEKARARKLARQESADFASLTLPMETRLYVPALLAFKHLVERPNTYGINLPSILNRPALVQVKLDRDMDIAMAARLAGMSVADLKALNPALAKSVIPHAALHYLILPVESAQTFRTAIKRHRGGFSKWTAYRVPHTSRIDALARQLKIKPGTLRQMNDIPPRHLVLAGSTLIVPRQGALNRDIPEELALTGVVLTKAEPARKSGQHKSKRPPRRQSANNRKG